MTPNPLIPQGSLQSTRGSNVRIAVATIVAIHVVFFGGLLLQGCKRDTKLADSNAAETNELTNTTSAPLTYPPIEPERLDYYSNSASLPQTAPAGANTTSAPPSTIAPSNLYTASSSAQPPAVRTLDPWNSANLGTPGPAAAGTPAAGAPAGGKEYTVKRGDSYYKIAKNQGTTIEALRAANPGIEPTRIQPGQKLIVPAASPQSRNGGTGTGNGQTENGVPGNVYVVKPGDNLTRIASRHGVTVSQLREANNLRYSRIDAGQKLIIPSKTAAAAASTNTF